MGTLFKIALVLLCFTIVFAVVFKSKLLYENYTQVNTSCSLSEDDVQKLRTIIETIKNTMDIILNESFPVNDMKKFKFLYTIFVTRPQYLLNTYGNKLSMYEFSYMNGDKLFTNTIMEFKSRYNYLLSSVFDEYDKFVDIISTKNATSCPVCDTLYILQQMERIDKEFYIYFANLFNSEMEISEKTKKTLMKIELDMMSITDFVAKAIQNQKVNSNGKLDSSHIDNMMMQINSNYLSIATDIQLFNTLNHTIDDIMTFITMKQTLIDDIKQCIIMPKFFSACDYISDGIVLKEGLYSQEDLAKNFKMREIGSILIPSNFNVLVTTMNGDVRVYDSDIRCIPIAVRSSIRSIKVSRKQSVVTPQTSS